MNYILKQFDEPLVKFSATTDTSDPEIQILWTNEEKAAFLPLGLTLTPDGLSRWLRRRTIPKNRAYVHSLLAKCGLNLNRPLSIISICKGLSLNDCYWVVEDGDTASFGKVNLFDNPFSNVLAELAFTGYGSSASALPCSPARSLPPTECSANAGGASAVRCISIRAAQRARPIPATNHTLSFTPHKLPPPWAFTRSPTAYPVGKAFSAPPVSFLPIRRMPTSLSAISFLRAAWGLSGRITKRWEISLSTR